MRHGKRTKVAKSGGGTYSGLRKCKRPEACFERIGKDLGERKVSCGIKLLRARTPRELTTACRDSSLFSSVGLALALADFAFFGAIGGEWQSDNQILLVFGSQVCVIASLAVVEFICVGPCYALPTRNDGTAWPGKAHLQLGDLGRT